MPFVIYLILFHAAWAIWVLIGYPRLQQLGEQTLTYALINLTIRGLLWVLPVFVYLRWIERVEPWSYLKLRKHCSRRVRVWPADDNLVALHEFIVGAHRVP